MSQLGQELASSGLKAVVSANAAGQAPQQQRLGPQLHGPFQTRPWIATWRVADHGWLQFGRAARGCVGDHWNAAGQHVEDAIVEVAVVGHCLVISSRGRPALQNPATIGRTLPRVLPTNNRPPPAGSGGP